MEDCGAGMDILIDGKWIYTRIELSEDQHLVRIKATKIDGLVGKI